MILTIPSDDPGRITANLRGPLLISHKTKLGKQLVLSEEFPTRHPLFPVSGSPSPEPAQASSCRMPNLANTCCGCSGALDGSLTQTPIVRPDLACLPQT